MGHVKNDFSQVRDSKPVGRFALIVVQIAFRDLWSLQSSFRQSWENDQRGNLPTLQNPSSLASNLAIKNLNCNLLKMMGSKWFGCFKEPRSIMLEAQARTGLINLLQLQQEQLLMLPCCLLGAFRRPQNSFFSLSLSNEIEIDRTLIGLAMHCVRQTGKKLGI